MTENLTKTTFAQSRGPIGTHEMLRVIMRLTLEALFQLKSVVVNYHKEKKQLKNFVLHLNSTLARQTIDNRVYPETFKTASPGHAVEIKKPSSFLAFVQPDKKFLGVDKG